MLKNYFFIAIRNIFKYKIYSLINIVGLAIGITCTILILLYVTDELSFDKFHSKAERTYRVIEFIDPAERSSSLPFPTSQSLLTDFPNYVENSVRFFNFQASTLAMEYAPENGQRVQFNEPHIYFVDSSFFKVFDFKLLQGNPNEVLNKPFSVLITESTAKKYFGSQDPIGKTLRFEGQNDLTVSGILEDSPSNSHIKFDFLISFITLNQLGFGPGINNNWYWNPCWTYITLKEGVNPETLKAQFPEFVEKYFHPAIRDLTTLDLQPLTDIHLYSNLDYEMSANSDVTLVYIFGIIAVFILVIAGINFINLATARSMKRAREVGVRKVMGALPNQLIGQFLAESVVFSLIAIILAIPFVYMFLPGLNTLAAKEISFTFITSWTFWAALLAIVVVIGFGGGIYPALFLSSFQPVKVLAGKVGKVGTGALLRKLLVVAQFTISGILIIGTIITYNQLNHLRNANLGFDKDRVVLVPVQRTPIGGPQYYQFKDRVSRSENVLEVSAGNMIMGTETQTASYVIEGKDKEIMMSTYFIEPNFATTLGMEFLAGRDFSFDFSADTAAGVGGVVVNESFLNLSGWGDAENAIGKRVTGTLEGDMRVTGVVKDFHYTSLRQPVAPFLFVLNPNPQARQFFRAFVYARIQGNNYEAAIADLESIFKDYVPNRPFEYYFLDEKINAQYKAEDSLGKIATVFSFMAIFVACLGLFGLSSFTAEQRTKEIGIRKVVGASVSTIVFLLSKQFLVLVIFANLVAWPSAYYIMDYWLSDFQTRIDISILPFIIAAVFTFVIAFATMSFQAVKAAHTDPVKSLKYE